MSTTPDSPALLATKLHVPQQRRGTVHRPRLTDRMPSAHRPVLTLVSAPAGFGKTTLLSQWSTPDHRDATQTTSGTSTAWVALDTGDNDPALFGSYLVAALASVAPLIGAEAKSLLLSGQSLRTSLSSLINDVDAHRDDVVLVLDDYHVIDAPEIHDAIAFILDHAPGNLSVVLATRADPPLPLARLRARGELLEIRAGDLRFSGDEAVAYLNGSMGLRLDTSDIDTLEARTEGWIAALQLAALSMQDRA
ncbi:MAG: helix-turn-helix transcriptional regulator, partial [Acidimicrobiia bacterium]